MRVLFLAILLALAGCVTPPKPEIVKVEMPIPVPCNIIPPKKPVMPFTEAVNTDTSGKTDVFADVKRMLAEIENRIGYESELEAAIKSCNSK